MRFRKKRCILVFLTLAFSYGVWTISSWPSNVIDDEDALSALNPSHFAEDSRKGILYHHKSHSGIVNFHVANDSWVRELLKPFDNERRAAHLSSSIVSWNKINYWPKKRALYPQFHEDIVRILQRMSTENLNQVDVFHRGTQLKLLLTLDGYQSVVFKPKWYDIDFILLGTPYVGKDRHYAEIAGFHISRLLQLPRIPPVVGRRFHFINELLPRMTKALNSTVYQKGNRLCFYGVCYYCKGPSTGVCTDEDGYIEGAMILYLPNDIKLVKHAHPWRRTYRKNVQAAWESMGQSYCASLLQQNPDWNRSVRLLDLIDASVFDFLIGNADRHHYETVGDRANSMVVLMDTGKGFGNPYVDEVSILAPLTQCCMIRRSTWKRLVILSNGPISEVVKRLLKYDPLQPVLSELNLKALDRRLKYVVSTVHHCIARKGHVFVLVAD